jgi:histidine triad (HIT) family protein
MAAEGGGSCLFCRIAAGSAPSRPVAIGDPDLERDLYAFEDSRPRAPHHILVIPREHIATVNDLEPRHAALAGRMILAAAAIAKARGIAAGGYRLVLNTNAAAGQSVFHVHLHLLGGRIFGWPPG